MGYLNPLLTYGFDAFARDAADAGVDGLIVVDCPPEEADPLADALDADGLSLIRLATPTTDDARLPAVVRRTSGFVYYVSVAGVTGVKEADAGAVAPAVERGARGLRPAGRGRLRHQDARARGGDRPGRRRRGGRLGPGGRGRRRRRCERRRDRGEFWPTAEALGEGCALAREPAATDGLRPWPMARTPKRRTPARPPAARASRLAVARSRPACATCAKRDTPENLWVKCPDTGRDDLPPGPGGRPVGDPVRPPHAHRPDAALRLHLRRRRLRADRRRPPSLEDPLKFSDDKPYPERLAAARKATGEQDAMAIGYGHDRAAQPAVVLVQDFAFMGGSLGMAAGEGFIAAAEAAVARDVPLVIFTAAGGARMQEGALSLMQMARTTLAIQELQGAAPALRRGADRPDHRRRHRLLRHAGRRPPGRARRPDRLRRPAG